VSEVVEDITGAGAETCSLVVVLAGWEHPANRAVPANRVMAKTRLGEDFIAVIFSTPKKVVDARSHDLFRPLGLGVCPL
jgi:hypothetical protein